VTAPSESDWSAALGVLGEAPEVALVCHVAPDGDALGSMLALGAALRARGSAVTASWGGSPFEVPAVYDFLPSVDLLVPPEQFPAAPKVLVALDSGSPDRLGVLADRLDSAACTLVIDHHVSNTGFGGVRLVDDGAAATAVLVAELLDRLGIDLTQEIATSLYTALVTDTGSFKYAATTPAVHELAARLLATGIRHDLINQAIWDTASFGYVQLLGAACSRAQLEPSAVGGLGLAWTVVTTADLARHGLGLAEVEGVIDVLRTAAEAEVALVVKQDPVEGGLKVSARSRGGVDVGAVCSALGGGGHRFAAGFTSYDDVDTTLAAVRAALGRAEHLTP
jgi:phosphoesterase RecJ-like protein